MEEASSESNDQPGAATPPVDVTTEAIAMSFDQTPGMGPEVQQQQQQQQQHEQDEDPSTSTHQQPPAPSTTTDMAVLSANTDESATTTSNTLPQSQPKPQPQSLSSSVATITAATTYISSASSPSSSAAATSSPVKLTPAHFLPSAMLGEGSYSQVYLVRSVLDQQQYAMKVLNKAHLQRHNRTTVAYAEKAALTHCSHPNIIRLYHTFQDHTSLYFILELCDGGDVASIIDENESGGGLPHQLVVYYAAQLLHCLHYLHHTAHVIHRDIKPDNLMLTATGQLKLVDFGTAKLIHSTHPPPAEPATATATAKKHSFVGTAAYVAPEILTSTHPHSYAVDQWSAGATIYQLITGRLPFQAASEYLTFQRILSGGSVEWRDGEGESGGRELVERLMERDEARRLGVVAEDWEEVKRMRLFDGVDWERLDEWRMVPVRQPGAGKKYSVMSEESMVGWRNSFSRMGGDEHGDDRVVPGSAAATSNAEARRGEQMDDAMLDSYRGSRLSVQQEGRESQSTDIGQMDDSKQERKDAHSHSQPAVTQQSASVGYTGSAPPSSFHSHLQAGETLTLCSAVRHFNRSSPLSRCFPCFSSTSSTTASSSASHLLLTSTGRLLIINLTSGECLSHRYLSNIRSLQCAPQQRQSASETCEVLVVDADSWQLLDGAKSTDWVRAWEQARATVAGNKPAASTIQAANAPQ